MGQEDAETEIRFEDLKAIVDAAIKNQKPSAIDVIEDERQLRYMQKYAELLLSKAEFDNGNFEIGLAIIAIGIASILAAISDVLNKQISVISGIVLFIFGVGVVFRNKLPVMKDTKNEFIHEIILKIEEKLSSRIQ